MRRGDPDERARVPDEHLDRLDALWRRELTPPPVRRPRIRTDRPFDLVVEAGP